MSKASPGKRFGELVAILEKLRSPEGCPWDREQTFQSLRPYLLEETYEILETIDEQKYPQLREELGDLLMHIVFQAQMAREQGLFDMADVIADISAKLVRRHPHVFGEVKALSARQVEREWEKIKLDDKEKTVLGGVPGSLPALLRAFRVQEKAAGVGFDWEQVDSVFDKITEEVEELKHARQSGDQAKIEEEFGDLLFSLVNLSRFWKVSPEDALRRTVEKFIRRFNYVEKTLKEQGKDVRHSTLEEMDKLWDEAKAKGIK
ncbi:MAG: nucleoside triphosphate pyrophosphohydrolase [Candidatus Zixiibacteriota bacterium]|nr:MAG: nucleoside triphosphate pyrophosphohydrolase [candidate division Zixibacteria bacterium]